MAPSVDSDEDWDNGMDALPSEASDVMSDVMTIRSENSTTSTVGSKRSTGSTPQGVKTKNCFSEVGLHDIPTQLWRALKNKVSLACLELDQPLSPLNYSQRFHELLWIEEFGQQESLDQYQINGVRLEPNGRFLTMTVPGLEDIRPSLVVGNRILINDVKEFGEKKHLFEGYIRDIYKTEILLRFEKDFFDRHRYDVSRIDFNVKFLLNRTVFRRCHHAIDLTRSPAPHRVSGLVERVLFPVKSRLDKSRPLVDLKANNISWIIESLNSEQKRAVKQALLAPFRPTPFIIYGPPGTGKTVTILEAILQVFKIESNRVLVCTATNSSADLIVGKLLKSTRVGPQDIVRVTAYHWRNSVPESLRPVTRTASEDQSKWLNHRIIVTTTSQAGVFYNKDIPLNQFTHLFVDEAAQVTEAEALIPITLCARGGAAIVLAGDHKQLGPFIHSLFAERKGLGLSLMERLMKNLSPYKRNDVYRYKGFYDPNFVVKLVVNYRSDEKIMSVPSKLFYDSELRFETRTDQQLLKVNGFRSPLVFYSITGEELRDADSFSWYNLAEVKYVCTTLKSLYDKGIAAHDIGVITPYRKQKNKIIELLEEEGIEECRVATIAEFQGMEKKVIIVSTVRSLPQDFEPDIYYKLRFVFNRKRFNVAVSRAMSLFIVIGDWHMLGETYSVWKRILDLCEHKESTGSETTT